MNPAPHPAPRRRYCGRDFSAADLADIQELLRRPPALNRAQLSRQVCQDLGWLNGGGQLKAMSCRVALLRLEQDGLLQTMTPFSFPTGPALGLLRRVMEGPLL